MRSLHWIRPASVERYPVPEEWPVFFRREEAFARRAVYELTGVRFSPRMGACWSPDWASLESFGSLRKWIVMNPVRAFRGRTGKLPGRVTVLAATGYAHFVLEEIPRLMHALREYPDADVVIPRQRPSFYDAWLETILKKVAEGRKVLEAGEDALEADALVLTQAEEHSGFFFREDLELVRSLLSESAFCGSVREKRGPVVYVSRRGGSRAFSNEAEVETTIVGSRGEVACVEKLSPEDQASLFANAGAVIAGHGAGLANLVWCRPGCRVLEIFSPQMFNDCFARTAFSLGLDYSWLFARPDNAWGEMPLNGLARFLDGATVVGTREQDVRYGAMTRS